MVPFSQHNPCVNFSRHPDSMMTDKHEILTFQKGKTFDFLLPFRLFYLFIKKKLLMKSKKIVKANWEWESKNV